MRVLVATDFSEPASAALREGAAMAGAEDALGVVYAMPRLVHESLFFPARDKAIEARAADVIERASTMLQGHVAAKAHRIADLFVDEGIDYAAIIERAEAWRADVIVVGSHGRSGLARLLGDVASKVARHASCNVLVVRDVGRTGHVVVATDFSNPSLPAVTVGAAEARRRAAQLDVVHAVGFVEGEAVYLLEAASPSITSGPDLAGLAAQIRQTCADLHIDGRCEALYGPAATAIIRHAESANAELVVVGAHGSTNLARMGMGSVAQKVLRACPCSVMIVRRPALS